MIRVPLEFAIYFYIVSTAIVAVVFWFWWQSKSMAGWEDFQYKGRDPFKSCEFCGARYVDSTGGRYSTCPDCGQLNEVIPVPPGTPENHR